MLPRLVVQETAPPWQCLQTSHNQQTGSELFYCFCLPLFLQILLELKDSPSYTIYLFSRGKFYTWVIEGKMDFIKIKKGQHILVHLNLQVGFKKFT